ncbi:uncharacterized protein Tco025E_05534 [Trypanosoma conorhini]|uniref:Uncharacterized protein n=1 Tax=Trypanosoma conorhini TaxID=83891 RepID=A0A3R7MHX3_9TRYP|nr:uncharacterized protein Tco025E_05534 [Trypanosoma conorhini]RNF15431.1 hypothetical protein Tco025E_05534 [Trypanosoma conorhini]
MNAEEYWRMKACEAVEEHHSMIQSQRDEIERLQRRCNDLLHERSMMRAAAAEDIRRFCVEHQRTQLLQHFAAGAAGASAGRLSAVSPIDSIPLHLLLQFLHQYSAGMVPMTENIKRKRSRETMNTGCVPKNLSQQRLVQRAVARRRLRMREDETMEEVLQEHGQPHEPRPCADAAR